MSKADLDRAASIDCRVDEFYQWFRALPDADRLFTLPKLLSALALSAARRGSPPPYDESLEPGEPYLRAETEALITAAKRLRSGGAAK